MKTRLFLGAAAAALTVAMTGSAAAADATIAESTTATLDELVVLGRGEARQVQTVSGEEIQLEVSGASPIKLVEKLPNVNFQTSDAYGAYEWGTRISVRSFDRNRLGFTLDGVPLGDMTYGNHNGLHISRAIAGENIGQVEVSQGASALRTASANDLGGSMQFLSRDPLPEFGGFASATVGSDDAYRGFLRLDSGALPTGTRGYLSYGYNTIDKFKGDGPQRHQHINLKVVQPVGEGGSLTGWINWSERRESDYQDLTLEMIDRLGLYTDNVTGNYALAVQLAEIGHNRGETGVTPRFPSFGTVYPGKFTNVDDAYYDSTGLRDDLLGSVALDLPVNDMLRVRLMGYGHVNDGSGLWATPFVASPNYGVAGAARDDAPFSARTTEYDIKREGLIGSLTLDLGQHEVEVGFWGENNDFQQARRYYGLDRARLSRNMLKSPKNPFRTDWFYDFDTTTRKFWISDTWRPTEALTIDFGFKSLSVENEVRTIQSTASNLKTGKIKAQDDFQPRLGVSFDLNPDSQLFAGYAENMRAFPSSGSSGPFSANQAGFDAIRDKLKPEIAKTFETGWRFKTPTFQTVLALYYVKFENRLFAVRQGSAIQGNPSALSNVGGVTAKGFETAADWKFADDWSLFASYAYNDSTYDDDTRDGNGALVAASKGKNTVDTPENILKAELAYDNGRFYAKAGLSYMSQRFFTYENDKGVASQFLGDLAVGYRFEGGPVLDGLEVQLNVSNLFDEKYISTIDSNGFAVRGDSQTLLAGAPRQVFVSLRKTF